MTKVRAPTQTHIADGYTAFEDLTTGADTVDAYASAVIFDTMCFPQDVIIFVENTHSTNSLTYKINKSIDQSTWYEEKAEAALAAGIAATPQVPTTLWRYYDVQIKSTVASTPATAKIMMKAYRR